MAKTRETVVSRNTAENLSPVPFQFADIKAMAAQMLKNANHQCQRKLLAANEQATEIEKVAYEDGHEEGYKKGFAKGEAEGLTAGEEGARREFAERTGNVAEQLAQVLVDLSARKQALQAEAEADLLRLSLEIARRVVRREIEIDPGFLVPVVKEAIGLMTERSDLLVRVSPADRDAIETLLPKLWSIFTDLGKVQVEEDPTMERGGVEVLGRESEVDMRLSKQYSAIERALLGVENNQRREKNEE